MVGFYCDFYIAWGGGLVRSFVVKYIVHMLCVGEISFFVLFSTALKKVYFAKIPFKMFLTSFNEKALL